LRFRAVPLGLFEFSPKVSTIPLRFFELSPEFGVQVLGHCKSLAQGFDLGFLADHTRPILPDAPALVVEMLGHRLAARIPSTDIDIEAFALAPKQAFEHMSSKFWAKDFIDLSANLPRLTIKRLAGQPWVVARGRGHMTLTTDIRS
jgi:hypothetical protein